MKVIYEKDIIEKIIDELENAVNNNKQIKEIQLTREESIEFIRETNRFRFARVSPKVRQGEHWPTVMFFSGVKICLTMQDNPDF